MPFLSQKIWLRSSVTTNYKIRKLLYVATVSILNMWVCLRTKWGAEKKFSFWKIQNCSYCVLNQRNSIKIRKFSLQCETVYWQFLQKIILSFWHLWCTNSEVEDLTIGEANWNRLIHSLCLFFDLVSTQISTACASSFAYLHRPMIPLNNLIHPTGVSISFSLSSTFYFSSPFLVSPGRFEREI